jgi:hypothetical protein
MRPWTMAVLALLLMAIFGAAVLQLFFRVG